MKLKLDENLGTRGAAVLERAGHDVATVVSQSLTSTADGDLLRICTDEGRCLVTLDLDFSNPLRFPPGETAGIAVLRPPAPMLQSELLQCCQILATGLQDATIFGQLWIVELLRIRCYQPRNEEG